MDRTSALRRFRRGSIVAIGTIAVLILIQALLVQLRVTTVPTWTGGAQRSGTRQAATVDVLYRAERLARLPNERASLRDAIAALRVDNRVQNDLSVPEFAIFARFVADADTLARHPNDAAVRAQLEAVGNQLAAIYAAKAAGYVREDAARRQRFRERAFVASAVMLAALVLLYALVMRPSERYIRRILDDLEERRRRFAAMFDNGAELMALYDRDGRMVRANIAAQKRLGFGAELIGQSYEAHVATRDHEAAIREFAIARAGTPTEFETTFLDVHGGEVPVLANLSPVVVRGEIVGVVGAARDVTATRASEIALRRSHERFRSLFELSRNAVAALSYDGAITAVNVQLERLSGYRGEDLIGKPYSVLVPGNGRLFAPERFRKLLAGDAVSFEGLMRCKDGTEIAVQTDASPIRVGGICEGFFVSARDLTAERALTRRLEEKDERVHGLYRVISAASDAGTQIDEALDFGAHALNMPYGIVVQITGDTYSVLHRRGPDDLLPVGSRMAISESIGARLSASPRAIAVEDLSVEPFASEIIARALPWRCYIGSRITVDNVPYGALVFVDTVARSKGFEDADLDFIDLMSWLIGAAVAGELSQSHLQELAYRDTLTGLANRWILAEHMRHAIAFARRTSGRVALHYIDLDGFKTINDTFGHASGDEVLCEVASRFGNVVRQEDLLARFGGDEFVAVQSGFDGDENLSALPQRFTEAIAAPISLSRGDCVSVGASFGVACYPDDGETLGELLRVADRMMYAQKQAKRVH